MGAVKQRGWEPCRDYVVNILIRGVHEFLDVLVALHLVVPAFFPAVDVLAIPQQHHEVGVEKQHNFILHRLLVEHDWLWRRHVEGILEKGRLDHGDTVLDCFPHQAVAIVEALR